MDKQPTFRFAPSPTGHLHLGHAYSALLNQQLCAQAGGRLLLRIEDTDVSRSRPTYIASIIEDLAWLGLAFAGPVRQQSHHMAEYERALHLLWQQGHIYPCFCSRKQAENNAGSTHDPDGQPHYGGTCSLLSPEEFQHRLALGQDHGWRLRTAGTPAAIWGDAMIAKLGKGSCYHIAVVVDDALQGVTHVVRGQDLQAATPLHQLLQQHLGVSSPHYHHHKLLTDDTGQKLAKSRESTSLKSLRAAGLDAATLKRQLGFSQTQAD